MKTVKKAIWISYDLGLKGDYQGLYSWFDNHEAVECGNGLAFFPYTTSELDLQKFLRIIHDDIKSSVKLSPTDRLYIICKDQSTGLVKGYFINGARKQSPWEGFGKPKGDVLPDFITE